MLPERFMAKYEIDPASGCSITAAHAARTHCKNGHPLTEDNLLGGASRARGRFCKTCARDRQRELRRVRV